MHGENQRCTLAFRSNYVVFFFLLQQGFALPLALAFAAPSLQQGFAQPFAQGFLPPQPFVEAQPTGAIATASIAKLPSATRASFRTINLLIKQSPSAKYQVYRLEPPATKAKRQRDKIDNLDI